MKRLTTFLMGIVATVGLFYAVPSEARLSCVPPAQAGLSTDSCTDRDYQHNLCIVEPIAMQETSGSSLCVLGKFRTPTDVRNVVDMVVTYQLSDMPSVTGTLSINFSAPEMAEARRTGEFMVNRLTLPRVGVYNVSVRVRTLTSMGFVDDAFPTGGSRVTYAGPVDTSVSINNVRYRFGSVADPRCTMMGSNCLSVSRVTGTDGMMTNRFRLMPTDATPTGIDMATGSSVPPSVSSVDVCIGSAMGAVGGSFSDVQVTNTITDRSRTPAKVITITKSCSRDREGVRCSLNGESFCPGGSVVTIPVGHGENRIVANVRARGDMVPLQIEPFNVDLKGPDVCVNYYNAADSNLLRHVDGRVLLPSEASTVKVDMILKACGTSGSPESVTVNGRMMSSCDVANPPTSSNLVECLRMSPICVQRNNEKEETAPTIDRFTALCPVMSGGEMHYQANLPAPQYPINTVVLQARDNLYNVNKEAHYFGYGNVRPIYDADRDSDYRMPQARAAAFDDDQIRSAMVTKGFGLFLPTSYLTGEVRTALLQVLNSDKFKEDVFPKLLDPHMPVPGERECLEGLQEQLQCQYHHLTGEEGGRIVAIKPFNDLWGTSRATRSESASSGQRFHIGNVEIPTMTFFSNNHLRLQVRINGMHGKAEMYTILPQNTGRSRGDMTSLIDWEDDDADNDGICDSNSKILLVCNDDDHNDVCDAEMGLSGNQGKGLTGTPPKCRLDTKIARNRCPDMNNIDPEVAYPGCSDQDDDGDGIPDTQDTEGRLVADPDFGSRDDQTIPTVIPLNFTTSSVMMNIDLYIREQNGKLHFEIENIKGRDLVGIVPDEGKWPISFDCDNDGSDFSKIYQGGLAGDVGNGQQIDLVSTRSRNACEGLEVLNEVAEFTGNMYLRKDQNTRKQLDCTFNAILRCSVPRQIEDMLNSYENREILTLSPKFLGKKFNMDIRSPLASSTKITLDQRGVGVKGDAILLPAGVTDETENATLDGKGFMQRLMLQHGTALFPEGSLSKFGPLSRPSRFSFLGGDLRDPVAAARMMGDEVNASLNEETINSLLQSVGLELWDFSQREEGRRFLDISTRKVREDFNLAIPDLNHEACLDEYGDTISANSWECLNYALSVSNIFGDKLNHVDFFGEGNQNQNSKQPLIMGNTLNPIFAPSVKLVDIIPMETTNPDGTPAPIQIYRAELEIAIGGVQIDIYEERLARDSMGTWMGTGEIRPWSERFPGTGQQIVSLKLAGKVSVSLWLHVGEQGLLYAEGGISSVEECDGREPPCLDRTKTHLDFTTVVNNTIVPDSVMSDIVKSKIDVILGNYLDSSERAINFRLPMQMPLEDFCGEETSRHWRYVPKICHCVAPERESEMARTQNEHVDCSLPNTIQNAWRSFQMEDYGIHGVSVETPSFGITSDLLGSPYLTIGAGLNIDLTP